MHVLFAIFLLPFGAIHFLPTIIALLRDSQHKFAIFLINLFFGWTVIGWIFALVWALRSTPRYVYVPVPQGYRRY
ncbi:superinfection immunity protein [Granulicella cerasi]|uniref:Superinfection immunity protein n=1 Tax=Granulicella cerasi TaxID=741063 RepID=A0ABW1Z679_9BACT|nr:superinfection immunity protein [Granulicella cerasi]